MNHQPLEQVVNKEFDKWTLLGFKICFIWSDSLNWPGQSNIYDLKACPFWYEILSLHFVWFDLFFRSISSCRIYIHFYV